MNTIQRDLNSAYHDSNRLRKNIIRVCKEHSTLIYELINASSDTSTLINVLQASIVNYEIIQKAFTQQYAQDQKNDHYFTDRQYRRESSFDRRDKYSNDRRDDDYSNDRRDEHRDEYRDRNAKFQNRRSKRCFVCEKSDC
jgi:hypothetical protein